MRAPSPASSSTKSNPVAKSSRLAASQTAAEAFAALPSRPPDAADPGSAAAHVGRQRLDGAFAISLHRIRPDPEQPRRAMDATALAELTESVRLHGILQPIAVRYSTTDDVYYIIAGERRYQAALAVGLEQLPCWIRTPSDTDILVQQIVENWQRADLHPFDLADALARLRDTRSYSQKDLARLTGKSPGEISKLLALLDLDSAVQRELRSDTSGALSKRHLYEVRKLAPEEQAEAVATVRQERLSAEQTERLVAEKLGKAHGPAKRGKPVTRVEYVTAAARVTVVFRRQSVSTADIVDALDEARRKADGKPPTINIVRAQSTPASPS